MDFFPGNTDLQVVVPNEDKIYILALVYGFEDTSSAPIAENLFYEILDTVTLLP